MVAAAGVAGCGPCVAQSRGAAGSASDGDINLIVNQTYTAGGLEFYRRFTDYWREKSDGDRYTLVIVERPSRRYGNQVLISLAQRPVFVAPLPMKFDAIRSTSLDAVEQVYASAVASNLRFLDPTDLDLGRDEW
jgi:curli production assembly/transport component CsgE